ncbi:MAG: hypothetical protein J5I90_19360 [Caldilineales bacterium]|nr:hypothetical protein [Caldilineales bacterium]
MGDGVHEQVGIAVAHDWPSLIFPAYDAGLASSRYPVTRQTAPHLASSANSVLTQPWTFYEELGAKPCLVRNYSYPCRNRGRAIGVARSRLGAHSGRAAA